MDVHLGGQAIGFYSSIFGDYFFSHTQLTNEEYSKVESLDYERIAEFERTDQRISINVQSDLVEHFNQEESIQFMKVFIKTFEMFEPNLRFDLNYNITSSYNFQHDGSMHLEFPELTFYYSAQGKQGLKRTNILLLEAFSNIYHEILHLAVLQTNYNINIYDNERLAYKLDICWLLSTQIDLMASAPFDPKEFPSKEEFLKEMSSRNEKSSKLKIQSLDNYFGNSPEYGLVKLDALFSIFSHFKSQHLEISKLPKNDILLACEDVFALPFINVEWKVTEE